MTLFAGLLADPALRAILAALPRARIVGGAVRDTIAGRPVADMDLATPDPPAETLAALARMGLRVVPTGLAHGTVTAISQGRPFEITTLRRDEETDGRHARVAWTTDFEEDAARRDFTINAMSVDRSGTLHDYFGGVEDLAAGRVRFVGEACRRIAEDALRILRYFRFFARYAAGGLDPDAAQAIAAGVPGLAQLSAERVWSELKRILQAPDPIPALTLMEELGVLGAILPEAAGTDRLQIALRAGAPADPVLRLAALIGGDGASLARRLRLSAAEAALLAQLAAEPVPATADTADTLRRLLADNPADILIGRSYLAGEPQALRDRLAAMPRPVFPLEGRHALALGALPGPRIGEALREVRAWWVDAACLPGEAECLARLAGLLGVLGEAR